MSSEIASGNRLGIAWYLLVMPLGGVAEQMNGRGNSRQPSRLSEQQLTPARGRLASVRKPGNAPRALFYYNRDMTKPDLSGVSTKPGVYLMHDDRGEILYVGKAKNLKKRVSSYWANYPRQATKVKVLLEKVARVETIVVQNEVEALILENELIKKHRPQFNVLLRDDKNYLYIRITMQDEFPRILLARKVISDGAKYFGPYTESRAVYGTLKLIKKIFPICSSSQQITSDKINKGRLRACLNYHLGICPGVCLGKVSSEDYKETMRQVARFISGQYEETIRGLRKSMQQASDDRKYELAGRLRDGIEAIEKLTMRQAVVSTDVKNNTDIIGVARYLNKAVIELMRMRGGKLLDSQKFALDSNYETTDEEVLSAFIRDYYGRSEEIPAVVLLPTELEDEQVVGEWLSERLGKKVELVSSVRGARKDLVGMASENAKLHLGNMAIKLGLEKRGNEEGIIELKTILKLDKLDRIEAYDISNTQGTDSVGSMVVFEDGKMNKSQYRRFKIKTVKGPNDYASLAEVLKRRFAHSEGTNFARQPDLIMIDGGKGQVSAVMKELREIHIPIIGVAKGDHSAPKAKDDVVIPGRAEPLVLPNTAPAKYLIQNIRDEAHRFALGLHTHLARKRMQESQLEKISGVGAQTRKKLIKRFGSMAGVRLATDVELREVVGKSQMKAIREYLN